VGFTVRDRNDSPTNAITLAEPQEDVDRQRDVGSIIIATPSPSIPTPNRPSNKPSVAQMAKSVTEMRMEEEEMWRAIVSVNSKYYCLLLVILLPIINLFWFHTGTL